MGDIAFARRRQSGTLYETGRAVKRMRKLPDEFHLYRGPSNRRHLAHQGIGEPLPECGDAPPQQ